MRRSIPFLLPLYVCLALLAMNVVALSTTPLAAAADVTSVARPERARWERTIQRPVRVFIRPSPLATGWRPELGDAVWASFGRWSTRGVPVRFARVKTASSADVVVEWVDTLPGNCIGKTWREDVGGEIVTARITLALHDHRGRRLSADLQRGAALHEVGHLLGLDHVSHRASIMYPQVWVTDLGAGDRDALRELYGARPSAVAD
jgi:hypothetical protein